MADALEFIGRDDLIRAERGANRTQHHADIAWLEAADDSEVDR